MQLRRNEIMTGLLVVGTVAVVAFVLILLGAPGLFRPLITYKIYFDNAAGLLGDMAIDFTPGPDGSGRARDDEMFAGERTPDLGTAAAKMLEVIKPVAAEATNTMKELEVTAQHLSQITDQNSELNQALGKF